MSPASFLLSDKKCLELCYKLSMNKPLDIDNPETLNEKIQWLKLNDRNPLYTTMADKAEAYKYALKVGEGGINVVEQYGKWSSFDEIDFSILPNQFVLKCNHDSGSVVICKDKSEFDKKTAKKKLEKKLHTNFYWFGRQFHYKNIKPCIIAERYMAELSGFMTDYKFLCFNGEPLILYVAQGMDNHSTGIVTFYDINKNPLPVKLADYNNIPKDFEWPDCYPEMVSFARKSASSMNAKFVRVDLYCIQNKIYFSEYTFYPTNGYQKFDPMAFDKVFGEMLKLY